MFQLLEKFTPILNHIEDNYSEDHNVRNAVIDTLIGILKQSKVKQPTNIETK